MQTKFSLDIFEKGKKLLVQQSHTNSLQFTSILRRSDHVGFIAVKSSRKDRGIVEEELENFW